MLTQRELDVLRGAADGERAWETAARLGVSTETVKTHRGNILRKLEARTMTQAVAIHYTANNGDER